MTIEAFLGALELGMIYSVLALGVSLSFRTLNMPDLTVDGSIVTGAALSASICSGGGNPLLALLAAFGGGMAAGAVTALLNTKLKIQPLLAGILVMLGVYSINLRIMGNRANIALTQSSTIYKTAEKIFPQGYSALILGLIIIAIVIVLMVFFLKTKVGFALRATGDNEDMVKASAINCNSMKLLGMAVSNGLVGLAGGMLAQYQAFADVSMGTGMVVIGLASVIVGEVIFGISSLLRRLIAVALGAIVYRVAIALAFSLGLPATDLKLVSAVIVTLALALGLLGESFTLGNLFGKRGHKENA